MNVRLAYGKTGLEVELPDDANVTVVEPVYVRGLADPVGEVQKALRQPIASPPLRELVGPSDTVGIAFSDITRPTPNDLILPVLLEELAHVPPENVTLFNGTGTHRPNTDEELRHMLGDHIVDRYRIVQNDANDRASHVLVGTTSGGNDVWLHRAFVACEARILTGFIEPHFFAGFSGGGKAVMPGLALLETVMRNHSARHLDEPSVRWGIREGNPLWEEIHEAAGLAEPTFLLNVTLNREQEITGVFAGDWEEAHAEGCAFVKQASMAPVDEPFDIVITSNSGYPLDLNVYQAVKGMSAAAQVVKEGGSIIVAADCWDGIPEHGDYGQMLLEADNLASLLEMARDPGNERQDTWQIHIQALVTQKADVYFYSHNLTDEQIEDALLIPCRSISGTVEALLERCETDAGRAPVPPTICVLPEGPQTVPYVRAAARRCA
jgi:nickel-dependent lactate racemase